MNRLVKACHKQLDVQIYELDEKSCECSKTITDLYEASVVFHLFVWKDQKGECMVYLAEIDLNTFNRLSGSEKRQSIACLVLLPIEEDAIPKILKAVETPYKEIYDCLCAFHHNAGPPVQKDHPVHKEFCKWLGGNATGPSREDHRRSRSPSREDHRRSRSRSPH